MRETEQTEWLCEAVATACQVVADTGLAEHVLGHISARDSHDELLLRCRGEHEAGLAHTTADDIRSVPLTGSRDIGPWSVPKELPIHRTVLRRRPAVNAVVHAHPPAVVALSLLDVGFQPIYGAYDMPGAAIAAGGIPVWPRAALVQDDQLADQMADTLGERPVAVLRGHGLVSVAEGPPERAIAQAVVQAVAVDRLARTTLQVLQAGGTPVRLSDDDLAALPDLGTGFTVDTMWRHLTLRTAARIKNRWWCS